MTAPPCVARDASDPVAPLNIACACSQPQPPRALLGRGFAPFGSHHFLTEESEEDFSLAMMEGRREGGAMYGSVAGWMDGRMAAWQGGVADLAATDRQTRMGGRRTDPSIGKEREGGREDVPYMSTPAHARSILWLSAEQRDI